MSVRCRAAPCMCTPWAPSVEPTRIPVCARYQHGTLKRAKKHARAFVRRVAEPKDSSPEPAFKHGGEPALVCVEKSRQPLLHWGRKGRVLGIAGQRRRSNRCGYGGRPAVSGGAVHCESAGAAGISELSTLHPQDATDRAFEVCTATGGANAGARMEADGLGVRRSARMMRKPSGSALTLWDQS